MTKSIADRDIARRTVVLGAAWSMPVIAAAAAVPLAAASAKQARLSAQTGGTIHADNTAGTASGTLNGGVGLLNVVGGPWETGVLSGSYTGSGVWNSFQVTKADGTPFVEGETIIAGGVVWSVISVVSDADGTWEVDFAAPTQSVSSDTVFSLPAAIFSGTFTPRVPSKRNPVGATVTVGAVNVNNGLTTSASVSFP